MAITDASGSACLASASTHEVKLAETALDNLFIPGKPEKLIDDKAYDSDNLDDNLLKKHGVEMIAPHRRNRTKPKTQDGQKAVAEDLRFSAEDHAADQGDCEHEKHGTTKERRHKAVDELLW